jgi:type I restriction enzyme R subunit
MRALNESIVELAALEYLRELGYTTAFGPDIAPDGDRPERSSYEHVYLYDRLRDAARLINPDASASMLDEAIKRLERAESQNPLAENLRVHQLLTQGVPCPD